MQINFCSKFIKRYYSIGMELYKKILKSPQLFFAFSLIIVVVYFIFSLNDKEKNMKSNTLQVSIVRLNSQVLEESPNKISSTFEQQSFYSSWPNFFESIQSSASPVSEKDSEESLIKSDCGISLTIEHFRNTFDEWSSSSKQACQNHFKRFSQIYEVTFKQNRLTMNEKLKGRVKEWLGNNDDLVKQSYAQVMGILLYFKNLWH